MGFYCSLDAVEQTPSGRVSLQGRRRRITKAAAMPRSVSEARRRCFQTRSDWLPRTKRLKDRAQRKKKFSPSCTAFQLKSGSISLAAVVLGCRLIPVLGSPERQVCLTIPVRPGGRVSLTLCRNEDVAVSFLQRGGPSESSL